MDRQGQLSISVTGIGGTVLELRTSAVGVLDRASIGGSGTVPSALGKRPRVGPVWLGELGFDGDQQADRVNHGGAAKAVLVYPAEHYPYWLERYGFAFEGRGLGENLRTSGWDESTVHPGDRFRVGDALVRVTAPRRPCYKLGLAHGIKDLAVHVQATGRTGFYLAVEEQGFIEAGAGIELVDAAAHGVSAFEVNRVLNVDKFDQPGIARVLAAAAYLPERWLAKLVSRQASGRDEPPAGGAAAGEDDPRLFGADPDVTQR